MSLEIQITKEKIADKYTDIKDQIVGERYHLNDKIGQKSNGYKDRSGGVVLDLVQTCYPLMDIVAREVKSSYAQCPELVSAHAAFVMSEYALFLLDRKGSSATTLRNPLDFSKPAATTRDLLVAEFARTLSANGKDLESLTADYFTLVRDQSLAVKQKYNGKAANGLVFNINGLIIKGFTPIKKIVNVEQGVTFDDIAGYDDAKEYLRDNLLIMNNFDEVLSLMDVSLPKPARLAKAYGLIPKGIIFHGPPGTGKTTIVEAFGNEANIPVTKMSLSDVGSKWLNETAENIENTIKVANRPILDHEAFWSGIIIDEIDGLGKKRSTGDNCTEDNKSAETLFEHMSGMKKVDGVLYFGMTNLYVALDPALIRSKRFSKKFLFGYLEKKGIADCNQLYFEKARIFSQDGSFLKDVDLQKVIEYTVSTSVLPVHIKEVHEQQISTVGADIEDQYDRALRRAILRYLKDGKSFALTTDDLIIARNEIVMRL
jgi:hypothetical protein